MQSGLSPSCRGKRLIGFFLGIPGSSPEGAGKKPRLPWRLPGWGGGWKLSEGAVGFLGLETCILATAGRIR